MYLLAIPVVFASFMVYRIYQVYQRSTSYIPGPWYSRWNDWVARYYGVSGRRAYYIYDLHQKYGPIVRVHPDEVSICDMAAFKEVYSVKETFRKSTWYTQMTTSPDWNVFNTNDIDTHRRHRKLLSAPMSESSLKSLNPIVDAKVRLAIQRMRTEMDQRKVTDVYKWFLFMASDIISQLSFGQSFGMLEQGKKNQFSQDMSDVAINSALRGNFPFLTTWSSIFPIPAFKRAKEAARRVVGYATEALRLHEQLALSDPTSVERSLIASVLREKGQERLPFEEIRSNALAYIVAGSDTTSNTLTYLVWSVCRHPQIKATLLKELQSLPTDFDDFGLRELPYLNQVIHETMRIYPAAPTKLPRVVPQGGANLCGYWLEEGITVAAEAYTMHRDPVIFPDPEAFVPARWAEPSKAMKDSFFAFGGGSRVCLGKHLAMMELRLATARFFLEFPEAQVSKREGMNDDDMAAKTYFLISPKGRRCLIQES